MKKGPGLLCFGLIITFTIFGQSIVHSNSSSDSTIPKQDDFSWQKKQILTQLNNLQEQNSTNQNFGGFTSYRKQFYSNTFIEDPNAFFTAIIFATLRKNERAFDSEEMVLIQKMRKRSELYFNQFNNPNDSLRYNFWRKSPPEIFPGNALMQRFAKKHALPDDIDDCALVNIAKNRDSLSIVRLKEKFATYASGMYKKQKSFYKQFKNDTVYSTWMGAAFPIDIDISVLSNVLMLNAYYHLKESKIDSNALDLMIQTVQNKKHINDAAYVSKYYAHNTVIIYHLARLISFHHFKKLDIIQPQLIDEANQLLLNKTITSFEKLILQNALMLMGEKLKEAQIIAEEKMGYANKKEQAFDLKDIYLTDFPFFIANMSAILNNPWNRLVTKTNLVRTDYYCPAYVLTIYLENLLLKNQLQ